MPYFVKYMYFKLFLAEYSYIPVLVELSFDMIQVRTPTGAIMTDKDDKGEEEKAYGGCEGPEAMYVKLVSSDGHEFIVKRDHALTSGTIKAMLSGPGM